ncbi:GNAT family N-acetyltransferase [Streptomyces werraensis]|uniref:GNAT family N-acetyltransferase n=1 Tax=Streptomyces werraensis TaxID=68284 RepID=UPI0037F175E3
MSREARAESTRFRMIADIPSRTIKRPTGCDFTNPTSAEIPALGQLMLAAYRGTPDEADAGTTIACATEEIRRVFDGKYGELIQEASFVAHEDNRPIAVTLITVWQGEPLLAYAFTAHSHTGQGVSRALITASINALAMRGHARLNLAVNENNSRARKLYESMGFRRSNAV